jgi:hypothetical protein
MNTDSVLFGQTGYISGRCAGFHKHVISEPYTPLGIWTVRKDSIIGTFVPFSSSPANHMLCSCAALEQCASTVLPRDEWSP